MRKLMPPLGATATAMALVAIALGRAEPPSKRLQSISVQELNKMQVIGWLGQPLGRIVTIEGLVAGDDYRRMKADLGHTLLRVRAVNERALPAEQVFHFHGKVKPMVGGKFRYTGYETGGFTGHPQELEEFGPPVAGTRYGFTTEFVIVREEPPRRNKH